MLNNYFLTIKRLTNAETRIRDNLLMKIFGFIPLWMKPNHITAIRFFPSWLLFFHEIVGPGLVLFLVLFGFLGDMLDGALARKREQITDFGKVFDVVADKVLAIGVLWFLFSHNILALKLIIHMVLPEVLLVLYGIWFLFDRRVKLPEPNILGRFKFAFYLLGFAVLTASQLGGISVFLSSLGISFIVIGIILSWVSHTVYAQDVIGDFCRKLKD